ncbi:MAG: S41 family peptidase [Bryobacteraceae bacterium]
MTNLPQPLAHARGSVTEPLPQGSGLAIFPRLFRLLPAIFFLIPITLVSQTPSPSDPAQAQALRQADASASTLDPLLKQFVGVLRVVESNAAGPVPLDKTIYEGAIPSMLRPLDPHTQFFDPDQFAQLKQMENSEQKGFGSIVSVLPGRVLFLQTFPGTPSNKAGIMPGDELVAVGNIAIANLEPDQIVGLLTQARQQKVQILVRRQGNARLLTFSLTPALMESPTVDRAFLLEPNYAYIRVTSWDAQTSTQLRDAIEKLGGNRLQGLVLDLRNNPGGIVKSALDAASMFLNRGQRILTAKGRFGNPEIADVPAGSRPYHFRLSVIINAKTASASEILTGALQDHDRATIVGEKSYGKGLVQSVMPLSNNAGLALTTAFYYTPSGRSIQRPLRNSLLSQTFSDDATTPRPKFKTDAGRVVEGGGGIEPDVTVRPPQMTRLEAVLDASGVVTNFATQYMSTHSPLPQSFDVTPDLLDDFKVFLAERNIEPSAADWSRDRPWITSRLKQEIVTQARGVAAGDELEMRRDPQVQAALQALRTDLLANAAAAAHY